MPMTECPYCYELISVDKLPHMGQKILCPSCQGTTEVVWLYPIELDLPIDDDLEEGDSFEENPEDSFLDKVHRGPCD